MNEIKGKFRIHSSQLISIFPEQYHLNVSLERKSHLGEENCHFYCYVIDFTSWEFNSSYHTRINCNSTMGIITVEVKLLLNYFPHLLIMIYKFYYMLSVTIYIVNVYIHTYTYRENTHYLKDVNEGIFKKSFDSIISPLCLCLEIPTPLMRGQSITQ